MDARRAPTITTDLFLVPSDQQRQRQKCRSSWVGVEDANFNPTWTLILDSFTLL